jgi:hypothetical protein
MKISSTGGGQFNFAALKAAREQHLASITPDILQAKADNWMNSEVNFGRYKDTGRKNKDFYATNLTYFRFLLSQAKKFYEDDSEVFALIERELLPKDTKAIAEKKEAAKKRKEEKAKEIQAANFNGVGTSMPAPAPEGAPKGFGLKRTDGSSAGAPSSQVPTQTISLDDHEEEPEEEEPEEEPEEQPKNTKKQKRGGRR